MRRETIWRGVVAEDLIGYGILTQEAMRSVVRAALTQAASPRGLPGRHHFYITFSTRAPGVLAPEHLVSRFPDEMTIVLEHQFWDLEVYPDRFRVILKFGGEPHPVTVPYLAITRFYDPSVRFGLQFDGESADIPRLPAVDGDAHEDDDLDDATPAPATVVNLDAFRKK
jgi:hypothetical protein